MVSFKGWKIFPHNEPGSEVNMLIPENGKWRWNDGPLCDSKEAALKTATESTASDERVFTMDSTELLEVENEND